MSLLRTLAPDATVSNTTFLFNGGSVHASLANGVLATYINGATGDECIVEVEDQPFTDKRIARVRAVCSAFTVAQTTLIGYLREGGIDYPSIFVANVPGVSPGHTFEGAWYTADPATGVEWVPADVSALRLKLEVNYCADRISIWSAQIQADVRTKPVLIFSNPNTYLQPVNPRVAWNLNADGDAPSLFRIKVFTQAVAEGGGFDPESSTFVYDSTQKPVAGSNSHQIPSGALDYDTVYYIYGKGSTIFPSPTAGPVNWWSEWYGVVIKTHSRPALSIDAPGGFVTEAQPDIAYSFTDADGAAEVSTLFRLYNDTTDHPETDDSFIWEKWAYGGTATMQGSGVFLANGADYALYGRLQAGAIFTEWAFLGFTATLTASAPPTITATPDVPNARMAIELGWDGSDAVPVMGYIVERSVDGGITWVRVRGGYLDPGTWATTSAPILDSGTVTFYDYECEFNSDVLYRASLIGDGDGGWVTSDWTEIDEPVTLAVKVVWIKSLLDPSMNMHMLETDAWLTRVRRKRRAFYEPLGRETPIGFREPGIGEKFTMGFISLTKAVGLQLEGILDANSTLLVQSPRRQWYVDVEADYTINQSLWDELRNRETIDTFSVPFQEVETPAVPSIVDWP